MGYYIRDWYIKEQQRIIQELGGGIRVSKALEEKIKRFMWWSERIILMKIKTKPKGIIIVQVYILTSNSSEKSIEEVYGELEKFTKKVKGDENLIILDDRYTVVWKKLRDNNS